MSHKKNARSVRKAVPSKESIALTHRNAVVDGVETLQNWCPGSTDLEAEALFAERYPEVQEFYQELCLEGSRELPSVLTEIVMTSVSLVAPTSPLLFLEQVLALTAKFDSLLTPAQIEAVVGGFRRLDPMGSPELASVGTEAVDASGEGEGFESDFSICALSDDEDVGGVRE